MKKTKYCGFDIKIDESLRDGEFILDCEATPDIPTISSFYGQLMEGLDQQLFDNMPPEATRKLLSQVLKRYRQIVGFDINADIDEILAVDTLMNQLAARGL